jgi:hypothetical protein
MIHRALAAALLTTALLAGCSPPPTTQVNNPHPPVPALLPEAIPKPPVSAEALMWQPGHWDWNGAGYVWAPGQYVPASGHGYLWMPGYWDHTPAGWTWIAPHWTS